MAETILTILVICVTISIPASMVALAIEAGSKNIRLLFDNRSILIRYFLVLFIITPALALLCYFIDMEHRTVWIAVIVISLAPASPGMLKNVTKLGGDFSMSVSWLVTSILISIVMIPLNLYIISEIINVNIDLGVFDVALKLFSLFILPILVGFIISKTLPAQAPSIKKILEMIAKIFGLVLVICLLIIALPAIMSNDISHILLILLFLIVSLAISHFMELPDKEYGPILSYSVILRLPAPALLLASLNGKTKIYAPEILTFLVLGFILMAVYGKIFYGKKKS